MFPKEIDIKSVNGWLHRLFINVATALQPNHTNDGQTSSTSVEVELGEHQKLPPENEQGHKTSDTTYSHE